MGMGSPLPSALTVTRKALAGIVGWFFSPPGTALRMRITPSQKSFGLTQSSKTKEHSVQTLSCVMCQCFHRSSCCGSHDQGLRMTVGTLLYVRVFDCLIVMDDGDTVSSPCPIGIHTVQCGGCERQLSQVAHGFYHTYCT